MAKDRTGRRVLAGLRGCVIVFMAFTLDAWAGVNQWTSSGPDGGYVGIVAWHPTRDGVAFAITNRIHRTTDNGANWVAVTGAVTTGASIVFHPGDPDRILVAGTPLLSSVDGGASFTAAGTQRIDSLAVSADGGTVFGAAANKVLRSTDFGRTWSEIATPITATGEYPRQISISPDDPGTLFLNYSVGSLYKSTNGGLNWSEITTLTGNVNVFAINPRNGQQLLAATGSNATLWRSNDGGATWTAMVVGPYYSAIAFDPLVANRVVANQYLGLDYSTDAGGLWFAGARISAVQKNAIAFSNVTAGKLITGTSAGVEVSSDAGLTLQFRNTGLLASDLRAIAGSKTAPFRLYASFFGGPEGLHLRQSGGWQPTGTSALVAALGNRMVIESLAVHPTDSSVAYVTGYAGVARTTDGGASWTQLLGGGSYRMGVAIDPVDPQVLYVASTTQGILRSPDGGASWATRNSGLPVSGANVVMHSVHAHPANPQRLLATDGNARALYATTDAGLNWSRVGGGLPANASIQAVAFDPVDPDRLYLGTADGMYRSTDAGVTWARMVLPINSTFISFIGIDPVAPGTMVVVVAGGAPAVLRTVDYGATWESLLWDSGANFAQAPYLGALDPAQPGNVIVGARANGVRELQVSPDLQLSMSGLAATMPLGSTPTLRLAVQHRATSPFAASDATVSLSLPAFLSAGSITSTRGSCTRAGQSVTCRLGAIRLGESAQIDIPLSAASGTGTLSASLQERETDLNNADNSVSQVVAVRPYADLRVTMPAPATANHGGFVVLEAQVANLGPQDALNARAVFSVPAGLVASSGGVCTASGTTVTCQLGLLAANATALVQIAPAASAIGQYSVSVTTDSGSFDPDATNNAASATATVRPVTDLTIALGAPAASVPVGQAGTSTATVTNAGADPVNVAVVTVSGTGLEITTATATGGTCAISNGAANCSLGALAAGASRTVDLAFRPTTVGTVVLSATTNSEAFDPAPGSNSAQRSLAGAASADLGVTVSASPAALNRQSSTLVAARIVNAGPTSAPTARLVLTFPAGLAASNATASSGTCAVTPTTVDCALGALGSGAVATVDVAATASAAGSATLAAEASTTAFDPVSGNNSATAAVTVRGLTDLAIAMAALPATLQTGQTASTTITVTNNGPDEAGIVVANLVPENLEVQSAVPSAGTCSISAARTDCSLGALAAGASRSIVVSVATRTAGPATLAASTSFEGQERASADNAASGSVSVSAPSNGGGSGGGNAGGGGGGSLGTFGALALLAWAVRSATRRLAATA